MSNASGIAFSRLTGQVVTSADGVRVGRLVDVTVLYGRSHPRVHRLGVGRGRRIRYLLPWQLVERCEDQVVVLEADPDSLSDYAVPGDPDLEAAELMLGRDVVDTQVVDLNGRHLSRVSDVLLVTRDHGQLEVAAVDLGAGSLLRRMGFGWLGDRLMPVAVDWANVHLTSRRGHAVQLATQAANMHRLGAAELAELLARLSVDSAVDVVRSGHPARSAAALHASHPDLRRRLLHLLRPEDVQRLVDAAPPESAHLLAELHAAQPDARRHLRMSGWRRQRPAPPAGSPADR